jgi:hypothetical protein
MIIYMQHIKRTWLNTLRAELTDLKEPLYSFKGFEDMIFSENLSYLIEQIIEVYL